MSDRAVGLSFLGIGTFLLAAKHLAQATYKSGDLPWNAVSYKSLEGVGLLFLILAGLSAAAGCYFFSRGERSMRKQDADQ